MAHPSQKFMNTTHEVKKETIKGRMSEYRWTIRQYDSEEKLDAGHSKWLKG